MLKNAPTLANGGVDTAESRWKFKKSQKCEEYMKIHENRIPKSVEDTRIRRAYVRNFILKARREMKDMK